MAHWRGFDGSLETLFDVMNNPEAVVNFLAENPTAATEYGCEGNERGQLPLHYFIQNRAPAASILAVLQAHPTAAREKRVAGNGILYDLYPLHIGMQRKAPAEVILAVLHEYPAAAAKKYENGEYPLTVGMRNNAQAESMPEVIVALLQQHPAAAWEKSSNGSMGKGLGLKPPTSRLYDAVQPKEIPKDAVGPIIMSQTTQLTPEIIRCLIAVQSEATFDARDLAALFKPDAKDGDRGDDGDSGAQPGSASESKHFAQLSAVLDVPVSWAAKVTEQLAPGELCPGWTALLVAVFLEADAAFFWLLRRHASDPSFVHGNPELLGRKAVARAKASRTASIETWGRSYGHLKDMSADPASAGNDKVLAKIAELDKAILINRESAGVLSEKLADATKTLSSKINVQGSATRNFVNRKLVLNLSDQLADATKTLSSEINAQGSATRNFMLELTNVIVPYLFDIVDIAVGDRVTVSGYNGAGVVHFIDDSREDAAHVRRVGVELDEPVGQHNGTFEDCCYFVCDDKHGVLVEFAKITLESEPGFVQQVKAAVAGELDEVTPKPSEVADPMTAIEKRIRWCRGLRDRAETLLGKGKELVNSVMENPAEKAAKKAAEFIRANSNKTVRLRLLCGITLEPVVVYPIPVQGNDAKVAEYLKKSAKMMEIGLKVAGVWNGVAGVTSLFGIRLPKVSDAMKERITQAKAFVEELQTASDADVDARRETEAEGMTRRELGEFAKYLETLEAERDDQPRWKERLFPIEDPSALGRLTFTTDKRAGIYGGDDQKATVQAFKDGVAVQAFKDGVAAQAFATIAEPHDEVNENNSTVLAPLEVDNYNAPVISDTVGRCGGGFWTSGWKKSVNANAASIKETETRLTTKLASKEQVTQISQLMTEQHKQIAKLQETVNKLLAAFKDGVVAVEAAPKAEPHDEVNENNYNVPAPAPAAGGLPLQFDQESLV